VPEAVHGGAVRPTPIQDDEVPENHIRRVIGPPNGDLTDVDIAPVEALIHREMVGKDDYLVYAVKCVLEEGDLDKLKTGGFIWVEFISHVVPFRLSVEDGA
jgi:hypothetical protein